jgi:hypothetical protein
MSAKSFIWHHRSDTRLLRILRATIAVALLGRTLLVVLLGAHRDWKLFQVWNGVCSVVIRVLVSTVRLGDTIDGDDEDAAKEMRVRCAGAG